MSRPHSQRKKRKIAENAFATLCLMLNKRKWRYDRDNEKLVVTTSAKGDDLTIDLRINVDVERELTIFRSRLPFDVPEAKREVIGRAVNMANLCMVNGWFVFDETDGFLCFKVIAPHRDAKLTTEVYDYSLHIACSMVDEFNDKFEALIKGKMTLQQFYDFTNEK